MEIRANRDRLYVELPRFRGGFNALWVIVDRLTKSVHFILVNDSKSFDQLGQIYIKEIVRLHWVPKIIMLDRDMQFVASF